MMMVVEGVSANKSGTTMDLLYTIETRYLYCWQIREMRSEFVSRVGGSGICEGVGNEYKMMMG